MIYYKYLLVSDIHVRMETLDICDRLFDEIISHANENKCPTIIAGDLFHTKAIIRSECLRLVANKLGKFNQLVIFLVGNHDFDNIRCSGSSLDIFHYIPNCMVIKDTEILNQGKIGFLAYCNSNEVFEEKIKKLNSKYLICHQGIRGFKRNNFKVDEDGVPAESLSKFDAVISGHYHLPSSINNITYIGSPYQQDYGETTQEKRIILWSPDENEMQSIPLISYPKYHTIEVEAKELEHQRLMVRPEDHVRFTIRGTKDECKLINKELLKKQLNFSGDLSCKFEFAQAEGNKTIGDTLDYETMLKKWIDLQPISLDKQAVFERGKGLLNGIA